MSHAHGQALFADGTVLHFEYNGTADVVCSALRLTAAEVDAHWRADNTAECTCGQPSEPCRLSTDYGDGFNWPGKACRRCMAITDGFFPYDYFEAGLVDGLPGVVFNGPETAFQGPLKPSDTPPNSQFSATHPPAGDFVRSSPGAILDRGNPDFRAFSGFLG